MRSPAPLAADWTSRATPTTVSSTSPSRAVSPIGTRPGHSVRASDSDTTIVLADAASSPKAAPLTIGICSVRKYCAETGDIAGVAVMPVLEATMVSVSARPPVSPADPRAYAIVRAPGTASTRFTNVS